MASLPETTTRVAFNALSLEEDAVEVRAAIDRVVDRGWFVLGPEVEAFEQEFAAATGTRHAVGVGNGTDAIALALRAIGVGPGDEVITSPLSAAFSALAIIMAGAQPVFADIDPERLTLAPEAIAAACSPRTRAILPVHLYGQAADMPAILEIATSRGIPVVEDCAQAHLATCAGQRAGTMGLAGAFSFYPTKNLGALGDAGAVVTSDPEIAERVRRLRNGGQARRYEHVEAGINSRLDELQAAVLRARLSLLPTWTARRRALAARYRRALATARAVTVPAEYDAGHVYHLFPVRCALRAQLQAFLASHGVETLVHYPTALHRQAAFAGARVFSGAAAERACADVLSLPLYPALPESTVDRVAALVCAFDDTNDRD